MKRICGYLVLMLLTAVVLCSQNARAVKIADLEKRLPSVTGLERIDVLYELASYLYSAKPEQSVLYGVQSYEMADALGDGERKARVATILANAYRLSGEVKKPFRYARKALNFYREQGDKRGIVSATITMGYLYKSIDNYNESLKYLVDALALCEGIDKAYLKRMSIFNHMGGLYIRLEEPEKAMAYYQQALTIARRLDNLRLVALYTNNTGIVHRVLGNYSRALECFQEALGLYTSLDNSFGMGAALTNIGVTYSRMKKYPEALEVMQGAVKLAEKINSPKILSDNLKSIGSLYLEQKEYTQAKGYFQRTLDIAEKIGDKTTLLDTFKKLSNLHQAMGDYELAMEYYKKFSRVKDQQSDETKNLQFLELQERYEAEKREKEIGFLKKNSEIQSLTRNALIAGFVLLALLLAFILKKYMYLFAFWKKQKYIGQYRLIKTIGAGGMSTVYLAHGIKDKTQIVAVKVLKEEYYLRESHRRRFKLEGTIIDKLYHPNIIKIFERGEDNERLFIIMEYIEGRTLVDLIDEGELPLDRCLSIMKQATAALAFIHGKNIIHRDLKPGNIMVMEKDGQVDTVKLLDFGLSKMKFQSRITMTGVLVGTASYMAPEQISDLESTTASDIFSLGLIFYEMLTGRTAFQGDTLSRIEKQILDTAPAAPIELRPGIPAHLNETIMQMLAKNPGQRPTAISISDRLVDP